MSRAGTAPGRRWTELPAGRGASGRPGRTDRAASEPAGADRADAAGRGDAPRGGRGASVGGSSGVDPAGSTGVRREVGTFVILDDITAAIAVDDRIGLVGPNGAGKTTLLRIAAGRDEPDGGAVHRKRGLTIGLLAQESHFDAAFMAVAGPPGGRPPRRRPPRGDGAPSWPSSRRPVGSSEPAYADLQHQFEVLGGYTLDQRVDEALSGLGFARDEWAQAADARCPAASRPGPRSPGS